ncbi:NAD(P)/FAD-dependent oxidoreductase [Sphingomonas sp. AP4-R1]|nr:NAD(P)/FAD-dependent oxidoreductase [Sphingomonas sp. AP4-R1]
MHDVLIVGAGPAGLTAAIYLSRFHLSVAVIDAGDSRAALIPRTRNHPGYPGGVRGTELLQRMRLQASEFGVQIHSGVVERLERDGEAFVGSLVDGQVRARSVLLATGVVNNRPRMRDDLHHEALERGLIRYCPICDGYEVTDRRVGVIGTQTHGYKEAVFLRMYSRDVTLVAPNAGHALGIGERRHLGELGVVLVDGPCDPLELAEASILVSTPSGLLTFDTIYPALGSVIRSELAISLGAEATEDGCLVIDPHQRTTVAGLYAAGDVAKGLDQISHAMGEAAVAATAIRNDLATRRDLAR